MILRVDSIVFIALGLSIFHVGCRPWSCRSCLTSSLFKYICLQVGAHFRCGDRSYNRHDPQLKKMTVDDSCVHQDSTKDTVTMSFGTPLQIGACVRTILDKKGLLSNTTVNTSPATDGSQAERSVKNNNGSGEKEVPLFNSTGTMKNKESTFFFVASDNQSKRRSSFIISDAFFCIYCRLQT